MKGASFAIERGQRVALIGPNGAGKTTLLETILGKREAEHGRVKLGHNVEVAYYSQQSLELPDAYRMIDVITAEGLTGPRARDLLGMFLFSGEDVEKPVSALSGGERRRLALARTVISGANLLVLDEPTNHLDIESREALEDALEAFPGTLLLVSHDRALIEAIATRTLSIEDGRLIAREGAFGAYASAHEAPAPAVRKASPAPAKSKPAAKARPGADKRPSQRAKRETSRLEREIAAMEEELGAIETRLSQPDAYEDPTSLAVDGRRHQELQQEIAYKYREWEQFATQARYGRQGRDHRLGDLAQRATGLLRGAAHAREGVGLGEVVALHQEPLGPLDHLARRERLAQVAGFGSHRLQLGVARPRGFDRRQQVVLPKRLDQVAEDPRLDRPLDHLALGKGRHDHDRNRVALQDLAGDLDPIQAGHLDVEHRNLGVGRGGQLDRLQAVGGLRHHVEPGAFEHRRQVEPDDRLILGDQDSAGNLTTAFPRREG